MAKERGFAVVSGSSTVVARIMENGTVRFGEDMAVTGAYSGTLVLNLPSGLGDGRVVQVNASNSASLAQLSASQIALNAGMSTDFGGNTSVSGALVYLSSSISSLGAQSNLDITDGTTTDSITFSSDLLKVTGTTGEVDVAFSKVGVTGTLQVGLPSDVTIANSLTVNGNISGSGTLQVGNAATIAGNLTVNGTTNTVNGNLQVNGNLVVTGSTVTLDVQNLRVEDPIIVLGSGSGALVDGDRGFVMTQSGSDNLAFGWDDSDQVFRLGTTTDDGTTQSLTITPSGTLELGGLKVTNATVLQGGLTVTGAVNLPNGSISNAELQNSSIEISGGVGISVSGLESISLGGSGSISLNLSELSTVTVDVATDSVAIVDASDNSSKLATIVNVVSGVAGTGLTATNGVLSVNYGSTAGTAVQGNTQVTFSGVSGEIEIVSGSPLTLGSGGTVTIGLPDNLNLTNVIVSGTLLVSGSTTLGTGTEDTVTVVGNLRHPIFTVATGGTVSGFPIVPDDYLTNSETYGGFSFYLTSSATPTNGITPGSGSVWTVANKWYFNESGVWHPSFFYSV